MNNDVKEIEPLKNIFICTYAHDRDTSRIKLIFGPFFKANGYNFDVLGPTGKGQCSKLTFVKRNVFLDFINYHIQFIILALRLRSSASYIFLDPGCVLTAWVARLVGAKVIYDVHEDYRLSAKQSNRYVKTMINALFHKLFVWVSHIVIVVNDELMSHLPKSKKAVIVYNCPDKETVQEMTGLNDISLNCINTQDEYVGVYHGTLSESRGVFKAAKAARKVNISGTLDKPLRILIIGRASDQLKNKIDTYRDVLFHMPRMPVFDALNIASKCHFGFQLVDDIPRYKGGTPTKIFEYIILGLPVVVTNQTAKKKTFNNRAIYVDSMDIDDIATGMEKAIDQALETINIEIDNEFLRKYSCKFSLPKLGLLISDY